MTLAVHESNGEGSEALLAERVVAVVTSERERKVRKKTRERFAAPP